MYYTVVHCTTLYYSILRYTRLYHAILHYTTLYYTILDCTVLCCAEGNPCICEVQASSQIFTAMAKPMVLVMLGTILQARQRGLVVLQGGLGFRVARRFGIAIDLVLVCCFLAGLLLVVMVVERR